MGRNQDARRPSAREVIETVAALIVCLGFAWFIHSALIAALLTILLFSLSILRWIWQGRYR